jgi:hypothetical protein
MAMMTAGALPSGDHMVARNGAACKRCGPNRGLKKHPPREGGYEWVDELRAFAALISTAIDWTAGDDALCLARQAGPGPRM